MSALDPVVAQVTQGLPPVGAPAGARLAPYVPPPTLDAAAWHGPCGAYALAADPYTEADPVGVLASTLAGVGAILGSGPHMVAGNDRHPAAVWPVLVGDTARGGKGTAWAVARAVLAHAAPDFCAEGRHGRILGGYGSGEALVDAIRDPDGDDGGAEDKRLLVVEREYARMLRVAQRDGSILSMIVREGWDGHRLQARSRARTVVASGYHLVVCGHISADEVRATLSTTEAFAGWANRFLWVAVHRSKRLPEGGNVPDDVAAKYGHILAANIDASRGHVLLQRTPAARARWAEVYGALGDDEPPGLLGAVVARAEPMCLRLSLAYALAAGSRVVDVEHVEAAYALWRYGRATAERVWGDLSGDPLADRLVAALARAGRLDAAGQYAALGRHVSATELERVRRLLVDAGVAVVVTEQTGGRPRTVLSLCERSERSE